MSVLNVNRNQVGLKGNVLKSHSFLGYITNGGPTQKNVIFINASKFCQQFCELPSHCVGVLQIRFRISFWKISPAKKRFQHQKTIRSFSGVCTEINTICARVYWYETKMVIHINQWILLDIGTNTVLRIFEVLKEKIQRLQREIFAHRKQK